jgi:hypothetical protein
MEQIIDLLRKAVEMGEVITLAYGGGSNPGASRRLIVSSCSVDSFRAFDETQRIAKSFKIEKVLWVKDNSGNEISNEFAAVDPFPKTPKLESLEEDVAMLRPKLVEAGWHIHESDNCFGVGVYFKNGKPKKTPIISISYFLPTMETIYDFEKDDFIEVKKEITGRERPWRVDSYRLSQCKTFGLLHSAMEFFVSEIEASAPISSK